MLSTILKSVQTTETCIAIIDTFALVCLMSRLMVAEDAVEYGV